MICVLIAIIVVCIFALISRSINRCSYIEGGARRRVWGRRSGNAPMNRISFLEKYYPKAYKNTWKVSLFFLNMRYIFNVFCSNMMNIREYAWSLLGQKDKGVFFKEPEDLGKIEPMLLHGMNRKFEGFFYTTAGMSNVEEFFPIGPDLDAKKLDKLMEINEYYSTGGSCYNPFLLWGPQYIEKLDEVPDIGEKMRNIFKRHGYSVGNISKVKDFQAFVKKQYNKHIDECITIYKRIMEYDPKPVAEEIADDLVFYLTNPNKNIRFTDMRVKYDSRSDPYYPNLFKKKNEVNTKLTGGKDNIDQLLGIITIAHMPVFTNTHFRGNNFIIKKSPGLMTSSCPQINAMFRKLPWVVSKDKKEVVFSQDPVKNYFLEPYASPLNHNAEIFCALFPTDMYASGCIGRFDESIIDRFEAYDWVPRLIMANPPYTNEVIEQSNRLTDMIHDKYKLVSIITMSRRDTALFEPLLPYGTLEVPRNIRVNLLRPIIESPYFNSIFIVPEALFQYKCLVSDKEFSVSSRKGAKPTDTIIVLKSNDPNPSHVEEVRRLFIDNLPKDVQFRIEKHKREELIENIYERGRKLSIDEGIFNRKMISKIISDFNLIVSGAE